MMAPLPKNEKQRLDELNSLGIIDTFSERDYDDLVFLASRIADTPISLISLVDQNRQWFKAKVGLEADETPREFAFCAHAILEPDVTLIVPDAIEDSRFSDNPLVTSDPKIRFYAGVPLVSLNNQAFGTLCIIDRKPRQITEDQIKALNILARQVMTLLDLRKAHNEISELTKKLSSINKFRSQVFDSASQELGLPISQIKATAELLLKDSSRSGSEKTNEGLTSIIQSCDKLLPCIDQFQQGSTVYEPI